VASLQTRLLAAVGLVSVAAVGTVALSARQSARQEFERFRTEIREETASAEGNLDRMASRLDGHCCDGLRESSMGARIDPGEVILVFDAKGHLLASDGRDLDRARTTATLTDGQFDLEAVTRDPNGPAQLSLAMKGRAPTRQIHTLDGSPVTLMSVRLPTPEGVNPGARFLGSVDRRLLLATVACAAVALLATWLVARRIVHPLVELGDATRALAQGHLDRRVQTNGDDEVAQLARDFNTMAGELERQRTVQRDLVHDVAHELRTPLTALRCRIETIVDGLATDPREALGQANEEIAHLSRLVSDLEEIAHAEAGELKLTIESISIADVVASAVRSAGLESDPRIRIEPPGAASAEADAIRLRQIVTNLLTNADRHTPRGGKITIRTTSSSAGWATIEVHNTGSRLSPDEIARVFDRFYRADPSRQRATGGSGLGLAIVKHLTEAQGGRVEAASDDTGTAFRVSLLI
jgi:signal transduction histidine kinase